VQLRRETAVEWPKGLTKLEDRERRERVRKKRREGG